MELCKTDLQNLIRLLEKSAELIDKYCKKACELDKARQCRKMSKKLKKMMIDKTNIRELIRRYEEAVEWLIENVSAPVYQYSKVASKMAMLSVRISIYYKKNKL